MSHSIGFSSSSSLLFVDPQNTNFLQKKDPFKTLDLNIFRMIVKYIPQEDLEGNFLNYRNVIKSCCKGHLRTLSRNINEMILKTRQCITLKDALYIKTPKANYDIIAPYLPQLQNLKIQGLPISADFDKFLDDNQNSLVSINLICKYVTGPSYYYRPDRFFKPLVSQTLKTLLVVEEGLSDTPSSFKITFNLPNLTSLSYHSNALTGLSISLLNKLNTLDLRVKLDSSTIITEISELKNLSNVWIDCTYENFDVKKTANQAFKTFLQEQTLPLASLHLNAAIEFDAAALTTLINKFNQLHTFECGSIKYFDDDCLVLLSRRLALESIEINFSKITDAGFEKFAQKSQKLKRFCGSMMDNISSLVPLTTHCPDIRDLDCHKDSFPKDQEEASSQIFLASLDDLKKFKVLNSLHISLPFVNNHVQNATKIVKDVNDSCKYLASVVTLITNEESLRIAQFVKF